MRTARHPTRVRPEITIAWMRRGENPFGHRRAELRKVTQTRLDAMARKAKNAVDEAEVGTLGRLVAHALVTTACTEFLESMPDVGELMRPLDTDAFRRRAPAETRTRRVMTGFLRGLWRALVNERTQRWVPPPFAAVCFLGAFANESPGWQALSLALGVLYTFAAGWLWRGRAQTESRARALADHPSESLPSSASEASGSGGRAKVMSGSPWTRP